MQTLQSILLTDSHCPQEGNTINMVPLTCQYTFSYIFSHKEKNAIKYIFSSPAHEKWFVLMSKK